jgi:dihydropteroate synthase
MTKLVGILNISPDSVSDVGESFFTEKAITKAADMIANGVDVIDIGAESTRPGASALDHHDEWYRLGPVLTAILPLVKGTNIEISVDSYHYQTIDKALSLGINWVNDLSGCSDKRMIDLVAEYPKVKLVLMHNLGIHASPKLMINKENYIIEIKKWAEEKIIHLKEQGITDHQIIFDPGISFGKSKEQSLDIIKNIAQFSYLGKIMVGHSRKAQANILADEIENHITSVYLANTKVDYIRVHDYMANKRATRAANYLW